MIAVRNSVFLLLAACTNTIRCEEDSNLNNADELAFWVRDPNFETTTNHKDLLKHVISQHVGHQNGTSSVVNELKALRKSGLSLDKIIDQMENSPKKMNRLYNREKQLRRENNKRKNLLYQGNNYIERKIHKHGPSKSKKEKYSLRNRKKQKGKQKHISFKQLLSMRRKNTKNNETDTPNKTDEHNTTTTSVKHKTKTETPDKSLKANNNYTDTSNKNKENDTSTTTVQNKRKPETPDKGADIKDNDTLTSSKIEENDTSTTTVKNKEETNIPEERAETKDKGTVTPGKNYEHNTSTTIVENTKKTEIFVKGAEPKKINEIEIVNPVRKHMGLRAKKSKKKKGDEEQEKRNKYHLSPYLILNQLRELAEDGCGFPDVNITLQVLGRTVEYNDIVMMKITKNEKHKKYYRAADDKYMTEQPEKKVILIVHGLSPMAINRIPCLTVIDKFKKLLSFYFKHLDTFDLFVVPMANPDGVAETRTGKLWNKNHSPQSACPGVCLDRNFDVAWNLSRVVSSCSQQYPGPIPFSEKETLAIRDVFHHHHHRLVAYFHVHSGSFRPGSSYKTGFRRSIMLSVCGQSRAVLKIFTGDAILYPKGYSDLQTDDDNYVDLSSDIDEAKKKTKFKWYTINMETLHNWYGKIAGSSVDFAASVYDIPYSLELVMQPFKPKKDYLPEDDNGYQNIAFEEVWQKVIDVIFKNIARSLKHKKSLSRRFST